MSSAYKDNVNRMSNLVVETIKVLNNEILNAGLTVDTYLSIYNKVCGFCTYFAKSSAEPVRRIENQQKNCVAQV